MATGPRAWGDSVQAVDWHFGLTQLANDAPQYKSTETWETSNTKRSVAFDECFKFATNYRVSNARLVVRYIGHPDKSQGRFVLKEFVPKGEIHKQYSLDDQWPTSEDEIALKTTHVKAADGFLFTPLVHNQKKNELFVDFDDKGFLEGTEPADDTSWGSGTSTVLDHTANWLKMAKGAEARESQKGLESCMVFLTGAMSSTNVDLEGQACWSVEIVQDVEVQIKTGAFAERMATPSPLYDPYYAQTQERINTELRAQGNNVLTLDQNMVRDDTIVVAETDLNGETAIVTVHNSHASMEVDESSSVSLEQTSNVLVTTEQGSSSSETTWAQMSGLGTTHPMGKHGLNTHEEELPAKESRGNSQTSARQNLRGKKDEL